MIYYNQTEKELINRVYIDGNGNEHQFIRRVWIDGNGQEIELWSNDSIVYLDEGQTFNVRQIIEQKGLNIDYTELTVDNFFFQTINGASASQREGDPTWAPEGFQNASFSLEKSYTNGVLTLRSEAFARDATMDRQSISNGSSKAYLVLKPDKLIDLGEGTSFDLSDYDQPLDNVLIGDFETSSTGGSYTYPTQICARGEFYKSISGRTVTCYVRSSLDRGTPSWVTKKVHAYLYKGNIGKAK